ncbi:hypothetical protein [Streptomyces bicolor]|uniref:hypothetical protein n=1 Tax=Streptomyces bicolor TaxID=66874 RepID=UPI00068D6E0B|nr:hypothetical protein [Streptomyces bicolor]
MDGEPGTRVPATGGLRIPPVVLKILVTVAVGTVTYVISNLIDPSQQDLWQLALAVVIGGAALIVQYLVDFEQRLAGVEIGRREHERELTELVDRGFQRVGEVTELFSGLEQSGMNAEDVARLARSAAQVGSQGRGFTQRFAQAEITRLAKTMTELASGTAYWEGENNDTLIALTKCARRSIDATSTFVDLAFWETATAQHYLGVQRDVIREHGVKVRRLFIVQSFADRQANHKLKEILRDQQSNGIEAGVLALSELPRDIRRVGPTPEFIIYDGELCFEMTTDVEQLYPNAKLDDREEILTRRMERFDLLWSARLEEPPGLAEG